MTYKFARLRVAQAVVAADDDEWQRHKQKKSTRNAFAEKPVRREGSARWR